MSSWRDAYIISLHVWHAQLDEAIERGVGSMEEMIEMKRSRQRLRDEISRFAPTSVQSSARSGQRAKLPVKTDL